MTSKASQPLKTSFIGIYSEILERPTFFHVFGVIIAERTVLTITDTYKIQKVNALLCSMFVPALS